MGDGPLMSTTVLNKKNQRYGSNGIFVKWLLRELKPKLIENRVDNYSENSKNLRQSERKIILGILKVICEVCHTIWGGGMSMLLVIPDRILLLQTIEIHSDLLNQKGDLSKISSQNWAKKEKRMQRCKNKGCYRDQGGSSKLNIPTGHSLGRSSLAPFPSKCPILLKFNVSKRKTDWPWLGPCHCLAGGGSGGGWGRGCRRGAPVGVGRGGGSIGGGGKVPIISWELVFHKDCTQRGKGNSQMPSEDNQLKKRAMVLQQREIKRKEGGGRKGWGAEPWTICSPLFYSITSLFIFPPL